MSRQYFVWKDPNCNGINPEWIEMTSREFCLFRRDPQNKQRYFVLLDDGDCDEAGTLIMEATKDYYDKWRKEYRPALRRKKLNEEAGFVILSLDAVFGEDDELTGHDVVGADQEAVEDQVINNLDLERLRDFLNTLSEEEMEIINQLYLCNPDELSERAIAKKLGLPQKSMNNIKRRILEKGKIFLAQKAKKLAVRE